MIVSVFTQGAERKARDEERRKEAKTKLAEVNGTRNLIFLLHLNNRNRTGHQQNKITMFTCKRINYLLLFIHVQTIKDADIQSCFVLKYGT